MVTSELLLGTTVHGVPSGNYDGSSQDWFGDAAKAANYYRGRGSLQTITFAVTGFEGVIVLEATLDTLPESAAWFDTYTYNALSPITDRHPVTITGNFAWMRVRVENFTAGTIDSITIQY